MVKSMIVCFNTMLFMCKFTVYGEFTCFYTKIMDLIEIGKHIRERRKELGLDQATLATLAGIGINALVRLERGSGNPRFDVLFNVLKTLGLSIHIQ